jgi:DNA helicase-2/ATP-dependent DNA helicase PcrA
MDQRTRHTWRPGTGEVGGDLNPAQRSAVEHGIDGNTRSPAALLIAAGAGTGKTKTLAHQVAQLILNGADPHHLLLLTFTRRAALRNDASSPPGSRRSPWR